MRYTVLQKRRPKAFLSALHKHMLIKRVACLTYSNYTMNSKFLILNTLLFIALRLRHQAF